MKVYHIFTPLFVLIIITHSLANQIDIAKVSIVFEESESIEPDTLFLPVYVDSSGQKESEVLYILGELDKNVRALSLYYSGGSYSVYKNCWWEKEKMRCSGYKGNIQYQFRLKEPKDQNLILETLRKIKDSYGERVNYSVSNLFWGVSDNLLKIKIENLRLAIVDSAINFSREISEKLKMDCKIHKMDYEHSRLVLLRGAHIEQTKTFLSKLRNQREKKVESV
ncbi:MAG: hypothetical protein N2Z80_01705 [Hydrogenothermaceae bacterium]|nr:hypothetical protein [Hydrogenothermaceae bacterium]